MKAVDSRGKEAAPLTWPEKNRVPARNLTAGFKRTTWCLFLLILAGLFLPAQAETVPAEKKPRWRYTVEYNQETLHLRHWKSIQGEGDGLADPRMDITGWKIVALRPGYFPPRGVHWFRCEIEFVRSYPPGAGFCLFFENLPLSYEIYWDGELSSVNGGSSFRRQEISQGGGEGYAIFPVYDKVMTPGVHHLAIRFFNQAGPEAPPYHQIGIYLRQWRFLTMPWMDVRERQVLFTGIYFTAALFCLALYAGARRNRAYLYFCFVCLGWFAESMLLYLAGVELMTLNMLRWMETGGYLIRTIMDGPFFCLFLLYQFGLPGKRRHMIIVTILLAVLLSFYFVSGVILDFPGFIIHSYQLFLTFLARRSRQPGSRAALAGQLLFLSGYLLLGLETVGWLPVLLPVKLAVIGFDCLYIACNILAIGQKIRWQNREFETVRLRSRRLETELLKTTIQPHFIMNTLNSIQAWFGKDPATAGRLISSLAEEFYSINRIAGSREIPLDEEIQLCRNHLELMGYRREASYQLLVEGETKQETIPPMVLHTLVENGLTHAFEPQENGTFHLLVYRENGERHLRLKNGGSQLKEMEGVPAGTVADGMGLRYVRARLEESYSGRWRLNCSLQAGIWEVHIQVKDDNRHAHHHHRG